MQSAVGTSEGSNNAAGVSIRATITAGTILQPGCHYLLTNAAASGYSGAVPGNQTYTVGITDDGGIALTLPDATIVDAVGMSNGSAYKEGTVLPSLGATTASNLNRGYERKPGGAAGSGTDTDNNANDFQLITPSDPQNSSGLRRTESDTNADTNSNAYTHANAQLRRQRRVQHQYRDQSSSARFTVAAATSARR